MASKSLELCFLIVYQLTIFFFFYFSFVLRTFWLQILLLQSCTNYPYLIVTANLEQLPRVLNIIYMMYNTISHPYLQQGQDIYNSCNQLSVSDDNSQRFNQSHFKTLPPINLKQSTTHIPVKISFPSNTISPNIPDSQITNTLATITDIVSPQPFFFLFATRPNSELPYRKI